MQSWLLVAHLGQLGVKKPGSHLHYSPATGWGPVPWLLPTAFLCLSTAPCGFYKVVCVLFCFLNRQSPAASF